MADKVTPGEPFRPSARTWNSMQEVSDWYQRFKRLNDSSDLKRATQHEPDVVSVRNNSGADRAAGEVLMIGGKLLTDLEKTHPYFVGVEYDDTQTLHSFGITDKYQPSTEIGKLVISGGVIAKVNVTDEDHRFAKPVNGSFVLESDAAGPVEIAYKPAGTGEKNCFIILNCYSGPAVKIYKFTLYRDRSFPAYAEKLPCILDNFSGVDDCDKPPSNPAAEDEIEEILGEPMPPGWNAQYVWFDDDVYPFARGPMDEDDCGIVGGSGGAIGFLLYDPSVSLASDESEECSKRFRCLICDQRSMTFRVTALENFPGTDVSYEYAVNSGADTSKSPKPMDHWPFSQPAHYWEWYSETDPDPNYLPPDKSYSRVKNTALLRGYALDAGFVRWNDSGLTKFWELIQTLVYAHDYIGGVRYENCAIETWTGHLKAYGKAPIEPTWEVAIQLYTQYVATGSLRLASYTGADGQPGLYGNPPISDDECRLESEYIPVCLFEEAPPANYSRSGVKFGSQEFVRDVLNNPTNITFTRAYAMMVPMADNCVVDCVDCSIVPRANVVIEGDDTCPE